MRRRLKGAAGHGVPPTALMTFTGTSNRDKLAWLDAREQWWAQAHPQADDLDQVGSLQWLFDGQAQVGAFHWCGSLDAACGDPDCMCVLPHDPESRTLKETSS